MSGAARGVGGISRGIHSHRVQRAVIQPSLRRRTTLALAWCCRWLGLATAVLCAVLWIGCRWRQFGFESSGLWDLQVSGGAIWLEGTSHRSRPIRGTPVAPGLVAFCRPYKPPLVQWVSELIWVPGWNQRVMGVTPFRVWLPLWIPLGAFGAVAGFAWYRHLSQRKPGHCPHCRYDRTGLAPGAVCPECGASHLAATKPPSAS